jgi:hypothetical protein
MEYSRIERLEPIGPPTARQVPAWSPTPPFLPMVAVGGGEPEPLYEFDYTAACQSEDGSAVDIAEAIKRTDDVYGPTEFNWKNAEYSALVTRKGDGSYGAYNNKIYSRGLPDRGSAPTPDGGVFVAGIVHNHPDILGDDNEDLNQRYPSPGDWKALQLLHDKYSSSFPGYDPSLWVVDAAGVTREFKLSERAYFDSDSFGPDQRRGR